MSDAKQQTASAKLGRARQEGTSGSPSTRHAMELYVDLDSLVERIVKLLVADPLFLALADGGSPWMDVEGAAQYLACSPDRVRKLISRRAVPFHQEQRGGRVFLHRRELDEW